MRLSTWVVGLLAATAVALYLEWHTDEVTVVLAYLLIAAIALGTLYPRLAPVAGGVLGFSILVAHLVSERVDQWRPDYLHAPIAPRDWIAMAVFGIVITAAAFGAGLLRSRIANDH